MSAYRYIPISSGDRSGQTPFNPLDERHADFSARRWAKKRKAKKPAACGKGPVALRKQPRKFPPFGDKTAVKAVT
jgi:hypothetical protein